jgi:hypothetical protein
MLVPRFELMLEARQKKEQKPPPRVSLMPWNSNYPMSATVTVHRVGLLDLTSIIERTIPAMGSPFNVNIAFSPRYWA